MPAHFKMGKWLQQANKISKMKDVPLKQLKILSMYLWQLSELYDNPKNDSKNFKILSTKLKI